MGTSQPVWPCNAAVCVATPHPSPDLKGFVGRPSPPPPTHRCTGERGGVTPMPLRDTLDSATTPAADNAHGPEGISTGGAPMVGGRVFRGGPSTHHRREARPRHVPWPWAVLWTAQRALVQWAGGGAVASPYPAPPTFSGPVPPAPSPQHTDGPRCGGMRVQGPTASYHTHAHTPPPDAHTALTRPQARPTRQPLRQRNAAAQAVVVSGSPPSEGFADPFPMWATACANRKFLCWSVFTCVAFWAACFSCRSCGHVRT